MVTPFPQIRRHLAGLALLFPLLSAPEARAQTPASRPSSSCFMVSLPSFEFPDIPAGQRWAEEVRLINNCRRSITVTSITGNPAVFGSNEPMPVTIPSDGYWGVYLYFAPTTDGVYEGTVTINLRTPRPEKFVIPVKGKTVAPPAISLSHDSLEATVAVGTSAPLHLDVTNDGDARLEATVDLVGPALPRPPAGWRVLYLNTVIPGQDADDFTRALSARPNVDTVIAFDGTAGTPTLGQLLAYDVVMANGASSWADQTGVGQVLKDYLHAGGKLAILAGGMNPASPGELYYPLNTYYTFHTAVLDAGGQAASFQTHPINEGVGVFSSSAAIPSSSIGGEGMGLPLGYYDNGHLLGAYHPQMPVVCLNVHPVDGGWSGDLPAWVGNAFDYLGDMMNWTTYTKPSPNDFVFVVTERSTRTLELQINTYRMAPGTYRGQVKLDHNDPAATNPLFVPIKVTVTP